MPELFRLEVHTPYRRFFTGDVEALSLTLADGEITVYAHHSFFIAPIVPCALWIKDKSGGWKEAFISEGILEVKHNVILMTNAAEWPEEIDRERALLAQQKAEAVIASSTFKFESGGAEADLRRARIRIKIKDGAESHQS